MWHYKILYVVFKTTCNIYRYYMKSDKMSRRDDRKKLPFTRAIRKSASSMLSAALQLFLLIKWRSLRTLLSSDFRASTESEPGRIRVNCDIKKRNEQTALANAVRFSFPFLYYMIFKMSGSQAPDLDACFQSSSITWISR